MSGSFLSLDVAAEFTSLPDSAPHSMAAPSEGVYVFLCRSPGPPAASASRAPSAPFTRPCIPTVPRGGETHPSGVWEPAVHRNETDTLTTDGVPVQVRFFPLLFCAYPCGFELARRSFELARPLGWGWMGWDGNHVPPYEPEMARPGHRMLESTVAGRVPRSRP